MIGLRVYFALIAHFKTALINCELKSTFSPVVIRIPINPLNLPIPPAYFHCKRLSYSPTLPRSLKTGLANVILSLLVCKETVPGVMVKENAPMVSK